MQKSTKLKKFHVHSNNLIVHNAICIKSIMMEIKRMYMLSLLH